MVASPKEDHASHLCLIKNFAPILYFRTIRLNAESNAIRKRVENSGFFPSTSISFGRSIRAHKAGESVSALMAEIPTATAMVMPNCV